jgi:hypothetical protein
MSLDGKHDDGQDIPIHLDDRTVPTTKRDAPLRISPPTAGGGDTGSPKSPSILHRPRGDTIRKELTRLKYARFQEGRYEEEDERNEEERENSKEASGSIPGPKHSRHNTLGARRSERHRPSLLPSRPKRGAQTKRRDKKPREREYVVDILYENQRGWFFCGIPLYSSRSLLNFDPSPWQTGDFKDSPVNITNAQVPDPTWIWAWPSWYVDMSHDVDEEGWEYSFSFRQGFAWHGSSPWWTSYVRRRRWLRKRLRAYTVHGAHDAWHKAHQLNPDYFTIHGAAETADSSRSSSMERPNRPTSALVSSTLVPGAMAEDASDSDEEADANIPNVTALLKRLKRTTVDRKKLDALKQFLKQGGAELHYLADAMPSIISLFMYQHSRREAITELELAIEAAQTNSQAPKNVEPKQPSASVYAFQPNGTANQRTADIQRAIDTVAAGVHAHDLAPDRTIRSPASAHSRNHHHHHSYHSSHPSASQHQHDHSISSTNNEADPPQHASLAPPSDGLQLPVDHASDAEQNAEQDALSLRTVTTTASQDVANPGAVSVAGSTVELGSSRTREVNPDGTRIKGIPAAAHVGEDMGLAARMEAEMTALREREEIEQRRKMKGKGKEVERKKERKDRKEWEDDGLD